MKLLLLSCFALASACGGTVTSDPNAPVPGEPIPPPLAQDASPPSSDVVTFAVDRLFLGDVDRAGVATDVAWRGFGFNLDHETTTRTSTNVCTLAQGAPQFNQTDGDFGIDNAWGLTVLPLFETALAMPTPTDTISSALASAPTLEIIVGGYRGEAGASALHLSASAILAHADAAQSKSLADGATLASGPKTTFARGYENGGVFVADNASAPLEIDLPITTMQWESSNTVSTMLELDIHSPIISFTEDPDGSVSGTIAGVLVTSELMQSALALAFDVDPKLCTDASAFAGIDDQIIQGSDILSNITNTAGKRCDAISIGLGFHAQRVASPTTVTPSPVRASCQ